VALATILFESDVCNGPDGLDTAQPPLAGPALYMVLSPLAGFGDWAGFVDAYGTPSWLVAAVVGTGAALGVVGWPIVRGELAALAGDSATARRLVLPVYAGGAVAFALAALLGPDAAAVFGFAVALGLVGFGPLALAALLPQKTREGRRLDLPRSWWWVGACGLFLLVFFAVLGPGIQF
jgi:hypothetical protein